MVWKKKHFLQFALHIYIVVKVGNYELNPSVSLSLSPPLPKVTHASDGTWTHNFTLHLATKGVPFELKLTGSSLSPPFSKERC
jgi:hypothetical protein